MKSITRFIGIVVIVALTVCYVIKTKWVLAGLFLIPLAKHLFVNDLPVLLGTVAPVSGVIWLKEACMLCF